MVGTPARTRARGGQAGFTLIELIVVAGIIIIITSLLLVRNSSFGGTVVLRSLAYDVALSIREAQTYGISVRQETGNSNTNAPYGYSVHFDNTDGTSYRLFVDQNTVNGFYDGGQAKNGGELVKTYQLNKGYSISNLCYWTNGATSWTCGASELNVVFVRPEPDACIGYDKALGPTITLQSVDNVNIAKAPKCNPPSPKATKVRIDLSSPNGNTVSIIVEITGQISVQ